MAPPIVKLPGKGKARPAPEPEELEDDETDEPVSKKPKVQLPTVVRRTMPTIVVPEALTDDEVTQEMEDAVERPSTFGYSLGNIRQHLGNKDYGSASMATKEALLATLIELVPLAERNLRASGTNKGIYQFNALIAQVNEMLVNLDGERDLTTTMQSILDEAIRPVFMLLSQMIIQFANSLKRQVRSELTDKDCKVVYGLIDEQIKELGKYVGSMYDEIQRRVDKKLES